MKITNFENLTFSKQCELRNIPEETISVELRTVIEKKIPLSAKESISYTDSKIIFYSKKIAGGYNEFEVIKKEKYLIGKKSYSTNNNIDLKIAEII